MAVTILRISEWRWAYFKPVLYWSLSKVLLQQSLVIRHFLMLNHLLFLPFDLNLCSGNKKEMRSLQSILTLCSFKSVHSRNLTVILKLFNFEIGPQQWRLWGMSPTMILDIHAWRSMQAVTQNGSERLPSCPALLALHSPLVCNLKKQNTWYSIPVLGMAFRGHSWICWKF